MYGFGELGGHGWGGTLADLLRVPFADAMLLPLPAGVAPGGAGQRRRQHRRRLADRRRVRCRSVPAPRSWWSAAAPPASASTPPAWRSRSGPSAPTTSTTTPLRLAMAERLGARPIEAPYSAPRPARYPITVDASADPAGLERALLSTEPGGTCTSVGIYYTEHTPLPLRAMYGAGMTFLTGRVHARAALPAVLELVRAGRFRPEIVTTRVAAWDDAAVAMLDPGPKVVITRAPTSAYSGWGDSHMRTQRPRRFHRPR